MKKIALGLLLAYASILGVKGQNNYRPRALKVEEINFVSGYYTQDGNNSAVTGGIGTEKLTDVSNTFDVKLSFLDEMSRKHSFTLEVGADFYTSASSDNINPNTISSASYKDVRIYPSLNWTIESPESKMSFGTTVSYSTEFDYTSQGAGLNFSKTSADDAREVSVKLNGFWDTWSVILPSELRFLGSLQGELKPRNSYNLQFSLAQVINKRLQMALILEPSYQEGLLATKYQRVYFTNNTVQSEELPSTRWKLPIGLRANYFFRDKYVLRGFYRFYIDEWKLQAHTFSLEAPLKFSPFFSISPFYRFYTQTGVPYFAPYKQHLATEKFYTSDYDLSTLNSHAFGAGLRFFPQNGLFGLPFLNSFEIRYEHYRRSTNLIADIITVGLKITPSKKE